VYRWQGDESFCTGFDVPLAGSWGPAEVAFWTGSPTYQPWKDVADLFNPGRLPRPTKTERRTEMAEELVSGYDPKDRLAGCTIELLRRGEAKWIAALEQPPDQGVVRALPQVSHAEVGGCQQRGQRPPRGPA
jgi:hypothetical protein